MSNETYKNFLSVTATRTRGVGREWEGRFTRPAWPASWRGTRWCSRSRSRRATRTRSRAWPGSAAPGWSAPRWSACPGGSMSWRPSTWPAGAICPQLRGRLLTTRCSRHLKPPRSTFSPQLPPGWDLWRTCCLSAADQDFEPPPLPRREPCRGG